MDFHRDLRAVRDLISTGPVHDEMFEERARWVQLCDGLDGLTDGATTQDRLAALNAVRTAAGMPLIVDDEDDLNALAAGLAAVRATLEERLTQHYLRFADDPLAAKLGNLRYAVEKAAESVRTSPVYDSDRTTFNLVFVETAREEIENVRSGLIDRGLDEHVVSGVDDLIYVLRRAEGVMRSDGKSGDPLRDAELLVRKALPVLIQELESLVREVDEQYTSRPPGWSGFIK